MGEPITKFARRRQSCCSLFASGHLASLKSTVAADAFSLFAATQIILLSAVCTLRCCVLAFWRCTPPPCSRLAPPAPHPSIRPIRYKTAAGSQLSSLIINHLALFTPDTSRAAPSRPLVLFRPPELKNNHNAFPCLGSLWKGQCPCLQGAP